MGNIEQFGMPGVPLILLGNKVDLEDKREVTSSFVIWITYDVFLKNVSDVSFASNVFYVSIYLTNLLTIQFFSFLHKSRGVFYTIRLWIPYTEHLWLSGNLGEKKPC